MERSVNHELLCYCMFNPAPQIMSSIPYLTHSTQILIRHRDTYLSLKTMIIISWHLVLYKSVEFISLRSSWKGKNFWLRKILSGLFGALQKCQLKLPNNI